MMSTEMVDEADEESRESTYEMLKQMCKDYSDSSLKPIAGELDREHRYPAEQIAAMRKEHAAEVGALREESEALQKELQRRQLLCQQKDTEIEALRRTVNDAEREKTEQAQALTKQEEELSKHAALAQLIHQLSGAKGPDVKSILGQKDLNVLGAEGQQGGSA